MPPLPPTRTGTSDGWTEDDGDCAPYDATIYPGAKELCNDGIDHDCDGLSDATATKDPDCDDATIGISNLPLETLLQAAPANIMFVVDDSGSMDWEFMTVEGAQGLYYDSGAKYYVFDDPGAASSHRDNNYYGMILPDDMRASWRTQWHQYNRLYYNPAVDYVPWAKGDGTRYPNADPDLPYQDPTKLADVNRLDLNAEYFSLADVTGGDIDTIGIVIDSHHPGSGTFSATDTDPDKNWMSTNHNEGHRDDIWDTSRIGNGYSVTATWTPPALTPGYYDVYLWWRNIDGYSTAVLHTINHKDGPAGNPVATPINVDQRAQGLEDRWNRLGTDSFYFNGTGTENVVLNHTVAKNWHACADAVAFVPVPVGASILDSVKNAHYYVVTPKDDDADGHPDLDANGVWIPDEIYLVHLDGDVRYYRATVSASHYVTQLTEVTGTDIPDSIKPPVHKRIYDYLDQANPTTTEIYEAERQNFANWYSYYRRRELTAKAAIGEVIDDLSGVQVGIHYMNNAGISTPALKVRVTEVDETTGEELYVNNSVYLNSRLYDYDSSGGTPFRRALDRVGHYFDQGDGGDVGSIPGATWEGPWYMPDALGKSRGGECQQSFTIAFTDGYYNGPEPPAVSNNDGDGDQTGVTDADGDELYADAWGGTLADIAMKYYKNDLSGTLADRVPLNEANHELMPDGTPVDWQHMVTYTVAFGLSGTKNPEDYVLYSENPSQLNYPDWPHPLPNSNASELIDDMWHAAVNGRGMYLSAGNPESLVQSLSDILKNLVSRIGSGSSLSINGEELHAGTEMYQAMYSTGGWWGDVKAYSYNPITGMFDTASPTWSANHALGMGTDWDTVDWDTGREIATYTPGTLASGYTDRGGLPFRWASLDAAQKALLRDDPVTTAVETIDADGSDRLAYIRGDNSNEKKNGGAFRDRLGKLGDIVHSAPVYESYIRLEDIDGDSFLDEVPYGVIYASANDGMLHAFHSEDGSEIFGYVPNLVYDHLNMLSVAEPNFRHMYYLDLTPHVRDIGKYVSGVFVSEKLLVGGLGKGGKGYFCLDVTNPGNNRESNAASWVKWEYPHADSTAAEKDNMGYSFSEAFLVKTTAAGHEWAVIFGNGYASDSHTAALYVLDARTGELIRMIDTLATGNNGLSTPTPVDVNGDYKADYVYAGDLKGNLWKFDLTGNDPALWGSSYLNVGNGAPEPLFRARGRKKDASGNYTMPADVYEQAITTKVNVIQHCDKDQHGAMVLFGTGQFLSTIDADDIRYQSIYGVWDYGTGSDQYLGAFNRGGTQQLSNQLDSATLLEQTVVQWQDYSGRWLRTLTDHEPIWITNVHGNPTNHVGWYFDLPLEKERVIRNSFVRDGKLVIITSIPEDDPCSAGGDSIVHEINACTGGRVAEAQFDVNGDGYIDDNDLVTIANPDWFDGSGLPEFIRVPPTGMKFDTMMYPPVILMTPNGQTERKFFSTASGGIATMEELAESRGMFYWRTIER